MNQQVSIAKQPDGSLGFAVGAFHFGVTNPTPFEMTVRSYADAVNRALGQLSNVNNIEMDVGDEPDRKFGLQAGDENPQVEHGQAFPLPSNFRVSFDLFIPKRIQDDIRQSLGPTGSEQFRVSIRYLYHSPVCFVVPVTQSDGARPSASIPVVREYLRSVMNLSTSPIRFGVIGPTPMHADFFAHRVKQDEAFTTKFTESTAYGRVDLLIPSDGSESGAELLESAFYAVSEEADLYYHLECTRISNLLKWSAFEEEFSHLMGPQEALSFQQRVVARLRRARDIEQAHRQLSMLEYDVASAKYSADMDVKQHYRRARFKTIQPLVEQQTVPRDMYPTEHFGKLLSFLEQRRSKAFELLVVLVASLIGGIAGAVVTLLTTSAGGVGGA